MLRRHGHTALAIDVAGFRRFGRSAGFGRQERGMEDREDGLDERGEPPPPYVEGGKPLSVSAGTIGIGSIEDPLGRVELRQSAASTGNGARSEPPGYHEQPGNAGYMARPTPAVLPAERNSSSRRLLSSSGSSIR